MKEGEMRFHPEDGCSIEEWWDLNHQEKNEQYKLWLTGSAGPDVWEYLGVRDRVRPNAVILNVGVGLGHCTRRLAAQGCIVHALDISGTALEKVKDVTAGSWLPSTLSQLPCFLFDLVISNLVAQHMTDKDLEDQIRHMIPALKQDGIIAMQFACMLEPSLNDSADVALSVLKQGGVGRSVSRYCLLAERAGAIVLRMERIAVFGEYGSVWYCAHLARPDFSGVPDRSPRGFLRRISDLVRRLKEAMHI